MLEPRPDNDAASTPRQDEARRRREVAAHIAAARKPQVTQNNGELDAFDVKPTNFHKGLPHNKYGMPDPVAFAAFVASLNGDDYKQLCEHADFDVAIGPKDAQGAWEGARSDGASFQAVTNFFSTSTDDAPLEVRNWESPLGGHQFDLMGPDAGDLAMLPAPTLGSSELSAEIAEVYAMALLRDVSFEQMKDTAQEVYEDAFASGSAPTVGDIIADLNKLSWFKEADVPHFYLKADGTVTLNEQRRREARWHEPLAASASGVGARVVSAENLFRGSVPGAKVGPYISQFLLIGNEEPSEKEHTVHGDAATSDDSTPIASIGQAWPKDTRSIPDSAAVANSKEAARKAKGGYINFGTQRIDQRVRSHQKARDYLTDWPLWLDVQNGANVRDADQYEKGTRFIGTPRDLATFVHFDQLYQAYFNACLLLFSSGMSFDQGFPSGRTHATRGSFATFGGPHVLSLLTEVASRALKVVRRQKFQHHLRGRPEQLAAMLTLEANGHGSELGNARLGLTAMLTELQPSTSVILQGIAAVNRYQNDKVDTQHLYPRRDPNAPVQWDDKWVKLDDAKRYMLPMAFPEGSPMHASYGAGHATVAGACVTILKAFFEMSPKGSEKVSVSSINPPLNLDDVRDDRSWWEPTPFNEWFKYDKAFVADDESQVILKDETCEETKVTVPRTALIESTFATSEMTIEGELNKLAANISIGRNMAGVHFYTDYYDSLRMGERLAVGLLQEQMATYRDPVSMRLTSFDNDRILISGDGCGCTNVEVCKDGETVWVSAYDEWWNRHTTITDA